MKWGLLNRDEKQRQAREELRRYWEESEDAAVGKLAAERGTPLNDHFAQGYVIAANWLTRHIAALERRIDHLERSTQDE